MTPGARPQTTHFYFCYDTRATIPLVRYTCYDTLATIALLRHTCYDTPATIYLLRHTCYQTLATKPPKPPNCKQLEGGSGALPPPLSDRANEIEPMKSDPMKSSP